MALVGRRLQGSRGVTCRRVQQLLMTRNQRHAADSSFTARSPLALQTSRSVAGRALIPIPAACRAWYARLQVRGREERRVAVSRARRRHRDQHVRLAHLMAGARRGSRPRAAHGPSTVPCAVHWVRTALGAHCRSAQCAAVAVRGCPPAARVASQPNTLTTCQQKTAGHRPIRLGSVSSTVPE